MVFRIIFSFLAFCVIALALLIFLFTDNQALRITALMNPQQAARVTHVMGDTYYSIRNYRRSAFYFQHLLKEYPDSAQAESAFFYWLQCMRFGHLIKSEDMVTKCNEFLERYPESQNADNVRKLQKIYAGLALAGIDLQAIGLKAGLQKQSESQGKALP